MPSPSDSLTQNFTRGEFEEQGYDVQIHTRIPVLCQLVRNELGIALYVSSGTRSPRMNELVGGSPNSSHIKGLACDITTQRGGVLLPASHRFIIVKTLLRHDVRRIGIAGTFIHFDIDEEKPQDIIWVY